ncbi:DUF3797 domain-containing protein [Chengkuizengella sediminis]|uniref:DUF3797 domain-containing protein n=1 Tax=Chengkuizengella sediminis TaxID=1885917 RepID=UPI001389FE58|nr:DUF3797 domain-containing protein [Chengkuizengella sediminis]
MKRYAVCEDCGSQYVANGEGTLFIDDKLFKRTCKCVKDHVIIQYVITLQEKLIAMNTRKSATNTMIDI